MWTVEGSNRVAQRPAPSDYVTGANPRSHESHIIDSGQSCVRQVLLRSGHTSHAPSTAARAVSDRYSSAPVTRVTHHRQRPELCQTARRGAEEPLLRTVNRSPAGPAGVTRAVHTSLHVLPDRSRAVTAIRTSAAHIGCGS